MKVGVIMAYIKFRGVTKFFGKGEARVFANKDIDFEIEKGEFVVILGPSGAGKSTLLNLLGGMDKVSEGLIMVDGNEVSKMNEEELTLYRRDKVGFVFQFYNLIPNLTAKENIEISSNISGSFSDPISTLKLLGLDNKEDKFPMELSGGEQQRVSIGRAIAKNPSLLLCDEPTGALDVETGIKVISLLKDINEKNGTTVVLITHNEAISQIANKVIVIKNGRVEKISLNENPLSPEKIRW